VRVVTAGEAAYLERLELRDGEVDVDRRILARREAVLHELARERPCASRRVDPDVFRRNLVRRRPERGLDPTMLWLLATAKANQAERFAITLAEAYGLLDFDDPVRTRISLQEVYHTRLLAEVVSLFAVRVQPRPPVWPARAFIGVLLSLPERWQLPLSGAAEMAGCVLFRALRDHGVALMADEPAVSSHIRRLYDQILADEIGHVGYITLRLGRSGRAVMRAVYRVLGPYLAGSMPELVALFGRRAIRSRFTAEFRLGDFVDDVPGAYAAAMP
jgi:hypothetical protein